MSYNIIMQKPSSGKNTSKIEQRNDFISTTTNIGRILYHPNRPHYSYHSYSNMLQEMIPSKSNNVTKRRPIKS